MWKLGRRRVLRKEEETTEVDLWAQFGKFLVGLVITDTNHLKSMPFVVWSVPKRVLLSCIDIIKNILVFSSTISDVLINYLNRQDEKKRITCCIWKYELLFLMPKLCYYRLRKYYWQFHDRQFYMSYEDLYLTILSESSYRIYV